MQSRRLTAVFIAVIILIFVSVGIFVIYFLNHKNTPPLPKKSDFKFEISYNEEQNTVTVQLYNLSDYDYDIIISGTSKNFADIFISCETGDFSEYDLLITEKASFPKNSSLKQEKHLDDLELSGRCEAYAKTAFYITNPDTSEREKLGFNYSILKNH